MMDYLEGGRLVRQLADAWPCHLRDVSADLDIDSPSLNSFLNGDTGRPIPTSAVDRLNERFGLVVSEYQYDDGSPEYVPGPAYVLFPRGSRKKTLELFNSLSNGGDLLFAAELVPANSPPSVEWRHLVFWTCGYRFVLMNVERNTKLSSLMDDWSAWFGLSAPFAVSRAFYNCLNDIRIEVLRANNPTRHVHVMRQAINSMRDKFAAELESIEYEYELIGPLRMGNDGKPQRAL